MGYAKKKSIPSLAMGGGSGALIIYLASTDFAKNTPIIQGLALFLFIFMGARAARSGAFMPAGLVAVLSGVISALLLQ